MLVEELRHVCAEPKKDAVELFRRICFNALIPDTDGHPRNQAIIAKAPTHMSASNEEELATVCAATRAALRLVNTGCRPAMRAGLRFTEASKRVGPPGLSSRSL
jgi:hypothetical protein